MDTAARSPAPPVTVFRRQIVIFVLLIGVGPALIWGGGALVIWLLGMPWSRMHWLWALAGPMQVWAIIGWLAAVARMSRSVRETDGALCPACGYDLRDRGDPGLCSECGLRVTDEQAAEAWRGWWRGKRRVDRDTTQT